MFKWLSKILKLNLPHNIKYELIQEIVNYLINFHPAIIYEEDIPNVEYDHNIEYSREAYFDD